MQQSWSAAPIPPVPPRPRRTPFGRLCWWLFIGFQILILLLMLASSLLMLPGIASRDPDAGVLFFGMGVIATGALWVVWFLGTCVLGLLALVTRPRAPSA